MITIFGSATFGVVTPTCGIYLHEWNGADLCYVIQKFGHAIFTEMHMAALISIIVDETLKGIAAINDTEQADFAGGVGSRDDNHARRREAIEHELSYFREIALQMLDHFGRDDNVKPAALEQVRRQFAEIGCVEIDFNMFVRAETRNLLGRRPSLLSLKIYRGEAIQLL